VEHVTVDCQLLPTWTGVDQLAWDVHPLMEVEDVVVWPYVVELVVWLKATVAPELIWLTLDVTVAESVTR